MASLAALRSMPTSDRTNNPSPSHSSAARPKLVGIAEAALDEHSLQLREVSHGEWSVLSQFRDGDVIHVFTKKCPCLGQELRVVRAGREAGQFDVDFATHEVLEIGVDRFALLLVDELDEASESTTHDFEHRDGDVLPHTRRFVRPE